MRKRAWLAILTVVIAATNVSNNARAELIYGVTVAETEKQLIIGWDSADPSTIWSVYEVPGSIPVLGIDATPYDVGVWIYNANGNLSRRNFASNASISFPAAQVPSGLAYGFEYNPVASPPPASKFSELAHFNIVSDLDQNQYRPAGAATTLPTLAYAVGDVNAAKDPSVFGIAYTNNVAFALTTTLYGIDSARDALVTIDTSTGTLQTVGSLGVDVISQGAFDISGKSGVAYATMKRANSSQSEFWTIDLATGAATSGGAIGGGITVTAMTAASPIPEPTSFLLMAVPLAIVAMKRRRS